MEEGTAEGAILAPPRSLVALKKGLGRERSHLIGRKRKAMLRQRRLQRGSLMINYTHIISRE